jgi:rhamnosyltransferase
MTEKVAIVVASFRPPKELVGRVASLLAMTDTVVVSDDGSPVASATILDQIEALGAIVLRASENAGIAAALNAGIAAIDGIGEFSFILTLDQDSTPEAGYINRAIETVQRANTAGLRVGLVSAESYSGAKGPREHLHGRSSEFEYAFDPMQSGSLIPHSTFDAIGGFDESLFIDGVDSEFTVRARTRGYDVVVGQDCRIEHHLGELTVGRIFGYKRAFNYHSPTRAYYISRNGTTLTGRYLFRRPGWVLRRLWYEAQAHAVRAVLSPGRGKLAVATLAGLRDAALRRGGRIPSRLATRLAVHDEQ